MTVVNSPLAKRRVPEKTLDIIAPPSNGPGELRCEPAAPKCPKRVDRRIEKSQPLQDARNALRQLSNPGFGWPGNGSAKSNNRRDHDKYEQKGPQRPGHAQS